MIRIITICCILLAVTAFAVMTVSPSVKITSSVPQLVNPGDEFMVRVRIDKAALKKGAVLQQVLPEGLSATAIENEGATFYFENQMVRFVWDKLPEKSVLVVAYKVKVNEEMHGLKKIDGTFIFAQANSTAQTDVPENILYISNDFPVSNAEHLTETNGSLSMNRIISDKKGEASNGYRITLEVFNENESGFATWTDQIPSGYTVEVNQANNGEFHMEGSLVKFYWEELPTEKSWSFSYTIYPAVGLAPAKNPETLGIMVYGSAASIKTCDPTERTYPVLVTATNVAPKPSEPISTSEAQTESSASTAKNPVMIPSIQRGTYYRVQIAATRRSPVRDSQFFTSRFHISSPVDMVEQDGWRKYCIGTFARMEPAKTFALETRSLIPDAFVVAYRDGRRIPVKEAMESLSISQ